MRLLTDKRFIEMHNKSFVLLVAFVLSVGGWFLWNIILSALYGNNVIYDVRGGLLHHFGKEALWWVVLILAIISCVILELAVSSLRSVWFSTDVS